VEAEKSPVSIRVKFQVDPHIEGSADVNLGTTAGEVGTEGVDSGRSSFEARGKAGHVLAEVRKKEVGPGSFATEASVISMGEAKGADGSRFIGTGGVELCFGGTGSTAHRLKAALGKPDSLVLLGVGATEAGHSLSHGRWIKRQE
jgi:hypothetical protein